MEMLQCRPTHYYTISILHSEESVLHICKCILLVVMLLLQCHGKCATHVHSDNVRTVNISSATLYQASSSTTHPLAIDYVIQVYLFPTGCTRKQLSTEFLYELYALQPTQNKTNTVTLPLVKRISSIKINHY